jgi:hypothetical protein
VFRKELEWELQAFSRANAELELLVLPIDKRQAAHLRAEKRDAAAHYARQVVERVLWDHDHGWEEPQRFGLDHHRPIRPEESCGQGGRQGVQAGSVTDGREGGPQRVVQIEDEIWGLHDREPCEIKVVSNHTCSLHTCVCAGSLRVRVRLSGFRRQGISSTPGGLLKCPIPVQVCAEQLLNYEHNTMNCAMCMKGVS